MALKFADRVEQLTSSTGTADLVLTPGSTPSAAQTFIAALQNADEVYYVLEDANGSDWEIGLGTWAEATQTLARTTIRNSSNSGSAINLSVGAHRVFVSVDAAWYQATNDKLDGIESGATADQTAGEIKTLYESNADTNAFTDADESKLDGIEANATQDQTAGEIKTAYESNPDTNAFTDADESKLDGIESNATADQTAGEIKTAYESNPDTNAFTDADESKLDGIESGAQVNVDTNLSNTPAAGSVDVESSTGTNTTIAGATGSLAGVLIASDKSKLDGIESGATADQTAGEIKTLYESNADTNAFTDADESKLDGIESGAQVNVGTDLSNTPAASTVEVASSTGNNTTLPAATPSLAGVLSAADKTTLDDLSTSKSAAELLAEATLIAHFADNTYVYYDGPVNDRVQTTFKDLFTFTRADKAMARTATQGLAEVAVDDQRLVGNREGLLIEEERTNLFEYPRRFDDSYWGGSNRILIPNAIKSPDGNLNATLVLATTDNNTHQLVVTGITVSSSTDYSFSFFAKPAGYDFVVLIFRGAGGAFDNETAYFDLANGTVGTTSGTFVDTNIEGPFTDGFYKVSGVVTSVGTTAAITIGVAASDGVDSFAGDGTSGIYIWHAQLEEGSFPTSPIVPDTTFTSRAGIATALNSEGTLTYFGVDVARDDAYGYDSDGILRSIGLLLEDSSENLFLYSEDLNGADWSILSGTITADDTAAPDDAVTADLWTSGNVTDSHRAQQNFTLTSGNTYTLSGYVKENGVQFIEIVIGGAYTSSSTYAIFDIINGTVTTEAQGDGVLAAIEPAKNGFYRLALTFDATASGSGNSSFSFVDDGTAGFAPNYTGDGVKGAYIWGAQAEESPYATSYIPTVSTTQSRSADVSSSPAATRAADDCVRTLDAEFDSGAWTFYAQANKDSSNNFNDAIFYFGAGDASNRLIVDYRSNDQFRLFYAVDGASIANEDITAVADAVKIAVSYDGSQLIAAANGVSQTIAIGTLVPSTWTNLKLGKGTPTGGSLNGTLKDFRILPEAKTASELQTLTGGS